MSKKARENNINKQLERMGKKKNRSDAVDSLYDNIVKESSKSIVDVDIDKLYSAPSDINFFPPISEDKMLEMMFSILDNGLFHPIIIWEKDNDGRYMILAGHNRVEAYKRIIEEYKDEEGFNVNDYKKIPSIIYNSDEIDERKAKEITIDTNYVQRQDDKQLMPTIVKNRMDIVRNRKDIKGRTIDIVASELGLSRTKVYEDHVIAENIIPEFQELYYNGELRKKPVLRFNWFSKETQRWMYETYGDYINNKTVSRIKKGMNKHQLGKTFMYEDNSESRVTFRVPKVLEVELINLVNDWIKARKEEIGDME